MQRTSVVLEPTNNTRVRVVRGPQRACETKIVAVGLNQAEETLSPFGVVGRVGGTPPRAHVRKQRQHLRRKRSRGLEPSAAQQAGRR